MKKSTKTLLITVVITLLTLVTASTLSVMEYAEGTRYINLDGNTYKFTKDITEDRLVAGEYFNTVTFIENGSVSECFIDELGIEVELKDKEVLNKVKIDTTQLEYTYNTDKLEKSLEVLNTNREKPEKAELVKIDNTFGLKGLRESNYINILLISEYIKNNLGKDNIEINLTDYYLIDTEVTEYNKKLENEINKFNTTYVAYKNGFEIKAIDYIDAYEVVDGKIEFTLKNTDKMWNTIDKSIERNLIEYDTAGGDWEFTTSNGEQIVVSGGTYGNIFDSNSETDYVMEKLKSFGNESDRLPIWKQEFPSEFKSYVEVSLDNQYVWIYKDGELVGESDCVTGMKNRMDTPTGVWYLLNKDKGVYLTGATYRTWVDYWMRFTERGHGLHDATWQRSFGGNAYTYRGSHGCVNLPLDFAEYIYDIVEVGMPVIVY